MSETEKGTIPEPWPDVIKTSAAHADEEQGEPVRGGTAPVFGVYPGADDEDRVAQKRSALQ